MSTFRYQVPDAYRDQVRPTQSKDDRTDTEILESLRHFLPVTSEKNIWAFWDKGLNEMPHWNQRNVIQWIRMHGSDWTVRVLDSVPDSPNFALKHIPAEMLPETYTRGTMDGPYVGPHSADILRGACLYLYGGVFMDVGNILIRNLDRVCWAQLADPASPFQISMVHMYGIFPVNFFVAARKGDPLIKRWHDLFVHLWQDRTNHSGMLQSPLLAFAQKLDFSGFQNAGLDVTWSVGPQVVMEYLTQVMAFARLTMLEDAGDGFSCTDYWGKNVLLVNLLAECWATEAMLGLDDIGQKTFETLALPLDSDPKSEAYQRAEKLVWKLLTSASMQKVVHGKGLTDQNTLGKLWDDPANDGKDAEEGTFAGLLRWGCVNLEQTREDIVCVKAPEPPMKMKKGVLEP